MAGIVPQNFDGLLLSKRSNTHAAVTAVQAFIYTIFTRGLSG